MSDTSDELVQEMRIPDMHILTSFCDTIEHSQQEISGPSNQPLPEMSGPCDQPLPEMSGPSNHACGDLLEDGRRRYYIDICVPLYKASIIGDWEAAKNILNNNREIKDLLGHSITEDKDTTLHIATMSQSIKFVGHLVDRMTDQQLALQSKSGLTALHIAAGVGNVEMAMLMVKKYPQLLKIYSNHNNLPIHWAALNGKDDMVDYLYRENKNMAADIDLHRLFLNCIEADLFDCALRILDDQNNDIGFPPRDYARNALYTLARKTYAFKDIKSWKYSITWVRPAMIRESVATELLGKMWKKIMERPSGEINDILKGPMVTRDYKKTYPFQILFVAAKMGNTKFLVELIRGYPDLSWKINDDGQTIFHIAASHRHESMYNLLYDMGSIHDMITSSRDKYGNNMLHLVGMKSKSPPENVSGAAFQMQRELLWFKEVNSKIRPSCREDKNNEGHTPHQLFIMNHEEMVSECHKWMKDTANQCMVVAALITTVVFVVVFTVPGGNDQTNGLPIFRKDGPFIAFVILDAISLILSSVSILMFLSIFTSHYAQEDFLIYFPKILMIGLTTLFLSIITMMVAFAVSFFVLYRNKLISIPIIISVGVGALVPIFLYMKPLFPLLVDAYRSTYGSTYLFGPKKCVLFYRNPRF